MRRGTTPTVTIYVTGCELSDFDTIYVTFRQDMKIIDKTGDSISVNGNTVKVFLSQTDTLMFDSSKRCVEVQLRAVNEGGVAIASNIRQVPVESILKEGVI